LIDDSLQVYLVNGTTSLIVYVVAGECLVEFSLYTIFRPDDVKQVKLYPMISPFWFILSGGDHLNEMLRERKVVLVQIVGEDAGNAGSVVKLITTVLVEPIQLVDITLKL
jgi:hypothetical protein